MKRIFLTGASSGIGLAVARKLTDLKHEVWGTSRDVTRLPKLEHFHPVQLDLSNSASVGEGFQSALSEADAFDVLINNAGSGYFGRAEELDNSALRRHFEVLVFAQIELMNAALEAMRKRGAGVIINVTSLASRLPVPYMAVYNAAKSAMASYTMSLQLELQDEPVRLIDVQPGDISTNFNNVIQKQDLSDSNQLAKVWNIVDRNMRQAPPPEVVANHIVTLIDSRTTSPRITVGDFFQARIAPLIFRFLPQRLRLWGLRKYYRI